MKKLTFTDKSLFHASYLISFQIAKTKKPYAMEEKWAKPCILTAAEDIFGPETAKKLEGIPLCNNTVQRRIEDLAKDIEEQVIEEIKKSLYYVIQRDESTDVINCTVLLGFVSIWG